MQNIERGKKKENLIIAEYLNKNWFLIACRLSVVVFVQGKIRQNRTTILKYLKIYIIYSKSNSTPASLSMLYIYSGDDVDSLAF